MIFRSIFIPSLLVVSACATGIDVPTETPERAIRSFNGSSVVIQSKTETPTSEDLALAQTACSTARFSARQFRIEGVSEYLYLC